MPSDILSMTVVSMLIPMLSFCHSPDEDLDDACPCTKLAAPAGLGRGVWASGP
jgi:hypothetical protein